MSPGKFYNSPQHMKKITVAIISAALLYVASGCLVEESSTSAPNIHVINASLENSDTRAILIQEPESYNLFAKWQGHEYIKVFYLMTDEYHSNAPLVQVSEITNDGLGATFTYKVPAEWDKKDTYDVKLFTSPCNPKMMDGKVYYNASIIREPITEFQLPVYTEGEINAEGTLNATFYHYYTYELLHIKNTSNEDITFTLLGFEEGTWFKQKGSLCIDDGQFVVNAPSTKDPVTTTTVSVKAGETGTIVSAYIPTGQPIHMARMIAQVNGQDVQSVNTKTSGIQLRQGHAYHMYCGWNGKELKFWSNEEEPLDVETLSATFDPVSFTGSFVGAVTNLSSMDVSRAGFMIWRPENPEGFVEYDATVADDNTFSLTLTYKDFLEMAYGDPVMGTYNVSAYAFKADGTRSSGGILEFNIDKEQPDLPTGPTEGDLIDLGLTVTWASCNIGASQPQEVGSFFAWGEVEQKSNYEWSNYALSNGTGTSLKKYCLQSTYGIVDSRTKLEPADDAAYVKSQGKKRMPTVAEWQELNEKCVWTKINYKNRDGYLVASPMTGNAIFIPCNGFKTKTNHYNFYAPYYWTSELDLESSQNAQKVSFINRWELGAHYRFEGLGVRPVSDSQPETTIDVNPTLLEFGKVPVGSNVSKTVTVSNTGNGPLTFYLAGGGDSFSYTPDNEVKLEKGKSCEVTITFSPQGISQMGAVLRVFSNATNGTKYIDCEGEGIQPPVAIPEAVDLGLSVKWASFNIGASTPKEIGYYYAWGETETKDEYTWSNYKFGNPNPYNHHILSPEDDVARILLGEGWRTPTKAEWVELFEHTRHYVQEDFSWVFIADNGTQLEFPKTGYIERTDIEESNTLFCWSSTLSKNGYPYFMYANYYGYCNIVSDKNGNGRTGMTIRAVYGGEPAVTSIDVYTNEYTGYEYLVTSSNGDVLEYPLCIAGSTTTKTFTVYNEGDVDLTVKIANPSRWVDYNEVEYPDFQVPEQDKKFTLSPYEEKVVAINYTPMGVNDDYSGHVDIYSDGVEGTATVRLEGNGGVPIMQGMIASPVDLGLSVKWASWNIGASKDVEGGNYYAWGETTPKYYYSWDTYQFYNKAMDKITKYNSSDHRTLLEKNDDAASVNWGEHWRIPTYEDYEELLSNCTQKWTSIDGVNGRVFTGPNGNTIFMPALGYCYQDNEISDYNEVGSYWFADLENEKIGMSDYVAAMGYMFYCGDFNAIYRGKLIRPVYVE